MAELGSNTGNGRSMLVGGVGAVCWLARPQPAYCAIASSGTELGTVNNQLNSFEG